MFLQYCPLVGYKGCLQGAWCHQPACWSRTLTVAASCADIRLTAYVQRSPTMSRLLLLSLAAGKLMEEPSNLELLVREDVALQQLVLASMGTNPLVVQQAVKIMSAVGAYAGAAKRLVRHNVVRAVTGMLASGDKVGVGSDSLSALKLVYLSVLCTAGAAGPCRRCPGVPH